MRHSYRFPWLKVKRGEGFFIPCIAANKVRQAGLNAALSVRIFDAKAYPAIKDGLMGVWFYR